MMDSNEKSRMALKETQQDRPINSLLVLVLTCGPFGRPSLTVTAEERSEPTRCTAAFHTGRSLPDGSRRHKVATAVQLATF